MKESGKEIYGSLLVRYPALRPLENTIFRAHEMLASCFATGGRLYIAGNGGSAADAMHIVGELMKDFKIPRPLPYEEKIRFGYDEIGTVLADNLQGALPAVALVGQNALETAYANDRMPELCMAQEVYGLGRAADVLLAISTSGNSRNILYAARAAKARGMRILALTGTGGGKLAEEADLVLPVPERETYRVQELHLPLYHALCAALEDEFFGSALA